MGGGNGPQWKSNNLASFYIYGIAFLVCWIAAEFYAWGVHELLDKTLSDSKGRNSFTFGDEILLVLSVVLVAWAYNGISNEYLKISRLTKVVMEFENLIDCLSTALMPQQQRTIIKIRTPNGQEVQMTACDFINELTSLVFFGPIFILWDSCNETTNRSAQAYELFSNFSNPARCGWVRSTVPENLRTNFMNNQMGNLSDILLILIINRINTLEANKLVIPASSFGLQFAIRGVRIATDNLRLSQTRKIPWIVSLVYSIIGFLYLLLAPFLLWFGQGWFMLYTYPVIFLAVGGIVSYRWYLSDSINSPTYQNMYPIHSKIISVAEKADAISTSMSNDSYNRHTKHVSITNIYNIKN